MSKWSLGDLSDPNCFQDPLNIDREDPSQLLDQLKAMLKIREVERTLAENKKNGVIGGPVHLGVGQEAIAVGVATGLTSSDRVFGAHRSHSHALSMGSSVTALFAEVLGRNTGLSKGMGGSMHLWDQPNGFYGSVPIVSGTVPLALGAGLAAKLQGTKDIGVSYLGDGAVEEGVVHESLNLAKVTSSPVLFVVENNLFASHMHMSLRQPYQSTARFADANAIPYKVVDGNDVLEVKRTAMDLIASCREGNGPAFLEAVTYRWFGHVDWREDIDVGVNRSAEELEAWRKRDPVDRLYQAMLNATLITESEYQDIGQSIKNEIKQAWEAALEQPYPEEDALLSRVYAG